MVSIMVTTIRTSFKLATYVVNYPCTPKILAVTWLIFITNQKIITNQLRIYTKFTHACRNKNSTNA